MDWVHWTLGGAVMLLAVLLLVGHSRRRSFHMTIDWDTEDRYPAHRRDDERGRDDASD